MADARDAELILRLYELRREPVMRQARDDMFVKFHPKSWEDVQAECPGGDPVLQRRIVEELGLDPALIRL